LPGKEAAFEAAGPLGDRELERPAPAPRGYFLDVTGDFLLHSFLLDPNDPARLEIEVPPGFRRVAGNESWRLYARCGLGG
jgi:hypothetical protein